MAEFLTTRKSLSYLEDIITNSKGKLVIVSPFIKFPKDLYERLQDADRRGVKITLIYGKRDLESETQSLLNQLKNLSLYFYEDLHAKCYFNEECMVITSMNFYEASEKNRELGILIRKQEDEKIFSQTEREINSILAAARKGSLVKQETEPPRLSFKQGGNCIRCGTEIPLDIDKPYCYECYSEWQDLDNGDPGCEERFCHICAKKASTSKAKPLCRSCYNKSQN